MLTSDLRYEISRTHFESGARTSPDEIRAMFADLEREATARLRAWFDGPIIVQRAAEMRYGEQIFEIDVPLDDVDWTAPSLVRDIEDRFHRRHEELYTYASRGQDVVFVNARVAAVGAVARAEQPELPAASTPCTPRSKRQAYFGGWREVAVYALDDLKPGHAIDGPAIIEAETTTVVIHEGDRLGVNQLGWLDVRLR
jgi:N-methylhydantoinase A